MQHRKNFASTMWADEDPLWSAEVELFDARRVRGNVRMIASIVRNANQYKLLILRGSAPSSQLYRDLIAGLVLKLTRSSTRLLYMDATWARGSQSLSRLLPGLGSAMPWIARRAIRLLDSPRVDYVVLSSEEKASFSDTWGVSPARVHFLPFTHTVPPGEDRSLATEDDGFLFAGGNSVRDYALLESAVTGTNIPTRIAAKWTPSRSLSNITAGTVSPADYISLTRRCHASVIPLKAIERSAGSQTYLNAMLMGKPVIVTEAPGVHDHITNGVTGVIVPAESEALRNAILHVFDPENADFYKAMGLAARESVLRNFTLDIYRLRLLTLARQLVALEIASR